MNWKQLSEIILCKFIMFSKFEIDSETAEIYVDLKETVDILGVGAALYYDLKYNC